MEKSICPLDCFDNCSLEVKVEGGKIVDVTGEKGHKYTRGFVCSKAKKLVNKVYSPDRLLYPMEKIGGGWRKISWEEAYDRIAARFKEVLDQYGSSAILHLHASGSNGVLKNLSRRFFNCLGGVTVTEGGICWDAGELAQSIDFGEPTSHLPWDLINSKCILLWGRDPAVTNVHLIPYLKEAALKGAKIIVINPLKVKTCKFADEHIAPRAGTDGVLALAMAHHILKARMIDLDFISKHISGFEEYAKMVVKYTPEEAEKITGIKAERIRSLAENYATRKPASIILGFGLQRYKEGVNIVRAIDSLAAITGNLGVSGGGVSYNFSAAKQKLIKDITGKEYAVNERKVPYPAVGREVQNLSDPPVKIIFNTCCNPVTQLPNTIEVKKAFHKADFVVTLDHTLTDTAEMSDLVLPVTTIFEEEQFVANGMSPFAGYVKPVIPRRGECKQDFEIFTELAERLSLTRFKNKTAFQWISEALNGEYSPEEYLGSRINPFLENVPWQDRDFGTPSGKVELYSPRAEKYGLKHLPECSTELTGQGDEEFSLLLMTPHPEKALHSQFRHDDTDNYNLPTIYIHPQTAKKYNLRNLNETVVTSKQGEIRALVRVSEHTQPEIVVIEEGWWLKEGGSGVNMLTPDDFEAGSKQSLYYECRCMLKKVY